MMRVAFISLGCVKNSIDTETIAADLLQNEFILAPDPRDSDLLIVNTCAFINPARAESEAVLSEWLPDSPALSGKRNRRGPRRSKGPLVVAVGCYAQRGAAYLRQRFPGLAAVWGLDAYADIVARCRALLESGQSGAAADAGPARNGCGLDSVYEGPRLLTTPPGYAWLRLSDGCDNRCAYCAIPLIRGPYRERPAEAIVAEAASLVEGGAAELVLVGQDTTRFDAKGRGLSGLLRQLLAATPARVRFRLLYAHPAHLDREVMAMLAGEPRLCRYLDLPIQHLSDNILRSMGRGYGRARVEELLDYFAAVKDFTLRTTLLAGFPGETEADFALLRAAAADPRLQWLGAFAYSPEAGTPAAELPGALPDETAAARRDELLALRQPVTFAWLDERLARRPADETVWLDRRESKNLWIARGDHEAPDGDGVILVQAKHPAAAAKWQAGDALPVQLKSRDGYDLLAVAPVP